jgi:chromosome segregation ATPase
MSGIKFSFMSEEMFNNRMVPILKKLADLETVDIQHLQLFKEVGVRQKYLEARISSLEVQSDKLSEILQDKELSIAKQVGDFKKSVYENNLEVNKVAKAFSSVNIRLQTLEPKIAEAEKEILNQKATTTKITEASAKLHDTAQVLNSTLETTKAQQISLRVALAETKLTAGKLNSDLPEVREQLSDVKKTSASIQEKQDQINTALAEAQSTAVEINSRLPELEQQVLEIKNQNLQLLKNSDFLLTDNKRVAIKEDIHATLEGARNFVKALDNRLLDQETLTETARENYQRAAEYEEAATKIISISKNRLGEAKSLLAQCSRMRRHAGAPSSVHKYIPAHILASLNPEDEKEYYRLVATYKVKFHAIDRKPYVSIKDQLEQESQRRSLI